MTAKEATNRHVAEVNDISAINLRDLPRELHAAFKAACARRRRTMRGMVIAFMRDAIKQPDDYTRVIDLGKFSRNYPDPR